MLLFHRYMSHFYCIIFVFQNKTLQDKSKGYLQISTKLYFSTNMLIIHECKEYLTKIRCFKGKKTNFLAHLQN